MAPFEALYAEPPAFPMTAETELQLMMLPPPDSIIFGITWREQRNVPRTLTFMTRSQSSSGMSTTVPLRKMPALLKSTVSLA